MKNEEKILKTISKLNIEFYKIQCKNWILNKSNGNGAAGRTLEILLNKKNDTFVLPDYQEIEIKTKSINSERNICLFSMAFDNQPLEIQRLLKIGGYLDKSHPEFKILYMTVSAKQTGTKYRYSYKLMVDYFYEVVRLFIYNRCGQLVNYQMSWSFEQLKSRLEHKLSYLALIHVRKSMIQGNIYFRYLNISFYQLKTFDIFLKLIENGTIEVTFKIGYFKAGEHYGEVYDHGTAFEISEKNLEQLFFLIQLDLYSNVVKIGNKNY